MNVAAITSLVIAITSLVTAIAGILHSRATRRRVNKIAPPNRP